MLKNRSIERLFKIGLVCVAVVAQYGCGGSSASVSGAIPNQIPEDDIPMKFVLNDGSTLFVLQSVTDGVVSGEAQLIPPPGSADPIELFQVSGTASGGTLTMILNNDEVDGSDTYSLTGSDSDSGSYQLTDDSGLDLLHEPGQTTVASSADIVFSQNPNSVSVIPFFGASGSITVASATYSITTPTTQYSSGGRDGLRTLTFNAAGSTSKLLVSKYQGESWAWFDVYELVSGRNELRATGTISAITGLKYLVSKGTNVVVIPSFQSASVKVTGQPGPYITQ